MLVKSLLEDSSIYVIIFEEVIEYLYNSNLVMGEIKRILRKDSMLILRLILSTHNLSSWIKGVEADSLSRFLSKVDKTLSHFPSLASHMFIVTRKS